MDKNPTSHSSNTVKSVSPTTAGPSAIASTSRLVEDEPMTYTNPVRVREACAPKKRKHAEAGPSSDHTGASRRSKKQKTKAVKGAAKEQGADSPEEQPPKRSRLRQAKPTYRNVQLVDSDDIETIISAVERGVILPVHALTYHQAELRRRVGLIEDGHLVVWFGRRFDDGGDWGYQSRPFQIGGRYRSSTQAHKTKGIRRLRVDCKINSQDALIISYTKSTGTSAHPCASKIDELREGKQADRGLQLDSGPVLATMTRGDDVWGVPGRSTHEKFLPPKTSPSLDHCSISNVLSNPAGGLALAPAPMKASTSRSLSLMLNPSPPTLFGPSASGKEHPHSLAPENIRRSMAHLLNPQSPTQSNPLTMSSHPPSFLNPDVQNVDKYRPITLVLVNDGVPHSLRHLLNPSPAVLSSLSSPPLSHSAPFEIVTPSQTPNNDDDGTVGDTSSHSTRVQQLRQRRNSK